MPRDKKHLTLFENNVGQAIHLILSPRGALLYYLRYGIAYLWQYLTPSQAAELCPEAKAYYLPRAGLTQPSS
jgi:hypothetical protein